MKRAFILLLITACDPTDVVVARLPPQGDGGFQFHHEQCFDNGACGPNAYCQKESCGRTEGRCQPRRLFCDALENPECGCNGVAYWNSCLREQAGVNRAEEADCPTAICDETHSCPVGAKCSRLLIGVSVCQSAPVQGTCVVVPAQCTSKKYLSCRTNDCADKCTAISSEEQFIEGNCP